jgi:plasmid stabilization system protein ParE
MPRGDKSKYTGKQERKADHIAESYESRGVPEKEAERRAWATVNKEGGGEEKRFRPRSTGIPRLIAKGRGGLIDRCSRGAFDSSLLSWGRSPQCGKG